jgi:hypothetical protein
VANTLTMIAYLLFYITNLNSIFLNLIQFETNLTRLPRLPSFDSHCTSHHILSNPFNAGQRESGDGRSAYFGNYPAGKTPNRLFKYCIKTIIFFENVKKE